MTARTIEATLVEKSGTKFFIFVTHRESKAIFKKKE